MISVIIPTYKEPDALDVCLNSLFKGQVNQNEIIVVVDGFYELNKPVLDKYPEIKIINFPENKGAVMATNWGIYNASNDFILVANDDNVFPNKWDERLKPYCKKGSVITINQIEPKPSMFRQTHIHSFGQDPTKFDLQEFWDYESNVSILPPDKTGSQWPFMMYKPDFMAVGGLDVYYPSPHVVDWDFMMKCEYVGFEMIRCYDLHLYHFVSISTRRDPEMDKISTEKEILAHQFFIQKWGERAVNDPLDNSKLIRTFKQK